MGETRIYVTKDKQLAQDCARDWILHKPEYHGVAIVDTGSVVVKDPATSAFAHEWKTEGEGPWFLVLATSDSIASGSGPAAALTSEAADEE